MAEVTRLVPASAAGHGRWLAQGAAGATPGPNAQAADRYAGIELRHLAALAAIAREGSFRAAAYSLGYVQSAISYQIAALERLVGSRLIERSRGNAHVALTEVGHVYLAHAEKILLDAEVAQRRLAALVAGDAGTLRVGVFQSIATAILPRLLQSFRRDAPAIRLVPVEAHSDAALFALLERGELELTFCELPVPDGPFAAIELMEDPLVLLVAASSPLAAREDPIDTGELAGMPLVGFNESRAQAAAIESLEARGIELRFEIHCDMNPSMQSFVAEGIGVAIVPHLAIDPCNPRTTVVELADLPPRRLGMAWRRDREPSGAAAKLIDIAQQVRPRFRT